MTPAVEVLTRYFARPDDDVELRTTCRIPPNRYYTVSVWPIAGEVRVDNRERAVISHKISKSESEQ